MLRRQSYWGVIFLWVLALGCDGQELGQRGFSALKFHGMAPDLLLPGTTLIIRGEGFMPSQVAQHTIQFVGTVDGTSTGFAARAHRVDEETLTVSLTGELQEKLIPECLVSCKVEGRWTLFREALGDAEGQEASGMARESVSQKLSLESRRLLDPRLDSIQEGALHPGDLVSLRGQNFLLVGEGTSLIELEGEMRVLEGQRRQEIRGLQIPVHAKDGKRESLEFELSPDILGILPGDFEGQLRVINQSPLGETRTEAKPWSFSLQAPEITAVSPLSLSRGKSAVISGKGFVKAGGTIPSATLLVLEGVFTPDSLAAPVSFKGQDQLILVPDAWESSQEVSFVLRVERLPTGELGGLAANPGRFSGSLSPWLYYDMDVVKGAALPIELTIEPQLQPVYLKALPGFDDALSTMGIEVEKEAVKERVLAVLRRDYEGINIMFSWEPFSEYSEVTIVEIASFDPNGTGLFGLDNTAGKDVGNERFDDVIGGYNADTREEGYVAYGGVFPAEFIAFSETLGNTPLSSPRFDAIFSPVLPALGGRPAEEGEMLGAGARAEDIKEAVRVFANLLGSTISHEVGHSLGLANIDGQFHNIGDNPGWLMDSGAYRSFEERAELDGQGPSFFGPHNRAYLEKVLPMPK